MVQTRSMTRMPPKKAPVKKKKKTRTADTVMVETAKEIHERKSAPRKLVAWLKGIRKQKKFIFAVGIILTGIYLGLSPHRRTAFKHMFKDIDGFITRIVEATSGGTKMVSHGVGVLHDIGRRWARRDLGVVDQATSDVSHLTSSHTQGDTFVDTMMKATDEASAARGMNLREILDKYGSYAPKKFWIIQKNPSLVGRPRLPMSHESENFLLKQWIPALRNHVYTINKLKATGKYTERHAATSERLAQQFSDAMNKTRKMRSV